MSSETPGAPVSSATADRGGVAAGGSIINSTINTGLDEKALAEVTGPIAAALTAQNERIAALMAMVGAEKGVEVAPLRAVLRKLGESGVPDVEIPARLAKAADELIELRAQLARLRNDRPELAVIRQQALELIDLGDLDEARGALNRGRAIARSLRQEASRSEAELLADEARIDHLQLAYVKAAAKYGEAAALVAPFDQKAEWQFVLQQANALADFGREFGHRPGLEDALALYERALTLVQRAMHPFEWAATLNSLGLTLQTLGERGKAVWLEKAIEVLRNALRVNLEGEPLLWATIQNSLGSALARLGQRETGTTLLEEAIAAFGEALKKRKRELDPLGWAMTQTNLGNALAIVSQRKSSTTYLQQAVEAFRAALQQYTQKRTPREWATTQDSLGNALSSLAQSEKRPKEQVTAYGKALLAFGEALKERTRDRMPIEWAATQMNLGLALLNFGECEIALGERDNGITRVEKAVVAFGEALKERTRDRLPLQWAEATFNQGLALMTLANLRNDLDVAVQALSRINAACEVFRHLGHEAHAIRCEAYLSTRARPFVERLRYKVVPDATTLDIRKRLLTLDGSG